MNTPKITVMMPVRNCEMFLQQAITSVLTQTYRQLELIICDDGSEDGTVALAEKIAKNDKRVVLLFNGSCRGIALSRNRILNHATGDLLCHVDGDDYIPRHALAVMVNEFNQDPDLVLAYSDMYRVNFRGVLTSVRIAKDFSRENLPFLGWRHLGMYRPEPILALGGYNEKLITCEDGDLFMRVALSTNHIKRVAQPLYYYRSHMTNIGHGRKKCDECDRLPHCHYYRIWSEARDEWQARQPAKDPQR